MHSIDGTVLSYYDSNYADLPMEILIEILSYLLPSDRYVAGLVCKRWLEATQHASFVKDLVLNVEKTFFGDNAYPVTLFLNTFRKFTFSVILSQVDYGYSEKFWNKFGKSINDLTIKTCDLRGPNLNFILKKVQHLESFRIEDCRELFMSGSLFESESERLELAEALKGLKRLSLSHNRFISDALFNRLTSFLPNIECIDLSGCHVSFHKGLYKKFYPKSCTSASESVLTFHYISQFIEQRAEKLNALIFSKTLIDGIALIQLTEMPNLKLIRLDLNTCDQLTSPGIIEFVRKMPSLQYLDLSRSVRLTDQALIEICEHLVNLKSLKLRSCRFLSDLGVKEIVKLKNLEVLDISGCKSISGQGIIEGIASNVNIKLQTLYISSLNICEKSIIQIAENLPQLRYLDLSFCVNSVTDLCLQMIFKNLIWLRYLNLDSCDKISDAAMTGWNINDKRSENIQEGTSKMNIPHEHVARQEILPMDVLNQYIANADTEQYKISLCSKAEQEIINDAKRKQAMLQMCVNQNFVDHSEKMTGGYSVSRLKGLRVLRLSRCNKISDVSLIYSFQLKELKELSLARCQQISLSGISSLTQNCPSIEILDLSECHNINDKSIEVITMNLKRLSNLSIERCYKLSDYSLDSIVLNCKSLKVLDVKGCRSICSEPNLRLANLKSLRTINISKPGPYVDPSRIPIPPPMPF